jgi:hypothetical protein
MKKLLIGLALIAGLTASAANYSDSALINGWNLYVTNGTAAVTGTTNNLYTYIHGEVFYSLTNNMGNTNTPAPDAFVANVLLVSDVNGDVVANAAIHYYIGYTNWIPLVVTNTQGQWFVTNSWPLASSKYPTYMYPATTNLYPSQGIIGLGTNNVTFNFQRGWDLGTKANHIYVWDTSTNSWSFNVAGTGVQAGATNIPIVWSQGATLIRLHSVANNGTNATIVNQLSVGQPIP